MMKSQDSLCAICGKPLEVGHVDHKHQKGEKKILKEKGQALIRKNVRGLLCMACNRGLAAFRDVPELFEAAAKYLRDWPSKQVLK
jgi:5-methylcytosine-specific restriction endonuclease McrA